MKPITEQSLYEILEIARDAPVDEIEKAYQRAKALYGPGSLATYSLVAPEEMALLNRRIEEARRVLLDAGARAGYDATLLGASAGAGAAPRPAPAFEPPAAATAPIGAGETTPAPPPPPGQMEPAPRAPAQGVPPLPAPVQAGASAPRPAAFVAPEGTAWTGEVLRQAREARGLTLHQIAERTKVARHHLQSIEADRYELLPAPVYLRGILISVAKELRLDPQKVSRSYLEAVQAAQPQKAPPKPK